MDQDNKSRHIIHVRPMFSSSTVDSPASRVDEAAITALADRARQWDSSQRLLPFLVDIGRDPQV